MNIEELSLKITNSKVKNMGKILSERTLVANYNSEWAYSHHAYIAFFKGKWYLAWSSGKVNEDDLGQRILYSVSDDFSNWSEPEVLMDSVRGYYSYTVLSCYGFYVYDDKLYTYITMQEFKPTSLQCDGTLRPTGEESNDILYRYRYMKYTLDGKKWSESIYIPSGGGTQCIMSAKNGRQIFFDSTDAFYNDGESPALWNKSGLSQKQITSAENRGAKGLCEAAGYMTKDGIVHMLNRSLTGKLWHSCSFDNGESWSDSYITDFAVEPSQFNVGQLPDGRFYIVCNDDKFPSWDRIPLYLYISEDGYNFNKRYIIRDEKDYTKNKDGLYKGGNFAYPTTVIRDNYLYISYTLQKEAVEVTKISLNDIM